MLDEPIDRYGQIRSEFAELSTVYELFIDLLSMYVCHFAWKVFCLCLRRPHEKQELLQRLRTFKNPLKKKSISAYLNLGL